MKTLMRFLSIILVIVCVITTIALFNTDSLKNEFILNVTALSINSIPPLISIAICSYCLEKNDTNYLTRIIPIYLMIPIVLSCITILFGIKTGFMVDLYNFLSCTYLEILGLSLIIVIKPNNIVSTFIKYVCYVLFAITFICAIVLYFDTKSVKLVNVLSSLIIENGTIKIYFIATIAQIFTILTLYISNYAFSEKIELEADEIDYDVIKEEAKQLANVQMNSIYNLSQKKEEPAPTQNNNGMMNINNQLGQNSNVGMVKEQAKEVNISGSTLDSLMPLSKGPVINGIIQEEKPVETIPPVEETIPLTTPPNLDIQEQMRLRMEHNQVNNSQ